MMGWCCSGCTTLIGISGEVNLSNIFARGINASLCAFTSVTSGLAGAKIFSACIRSCASQMEESVDEIFGMLHFLGKNSTVSEICSALVLGVYTLWHL